MSQITYVDLNEVEAGQENWLAVIARERAEAKREEHKRRLMAGARDRARKRELKSKVRLALKFNSNHDELGRFASGDSNGSSQQSGAGSQSSGASSQGSGGDSGGVRRETGGVESSGAAAPVPTAPLRGSPTTAEIRGVGTVKVEPNIKARQAAADYCKKAGIEYDPPTEYVKVDKERAGRIATAYEQMKNDPEDPEVKAAYAKMAEETIAQYQAVMDTGLNVEFIDYAKTGDPYAVSPRLAIEDVKNNNHFWVFPTEGGFGSDATFDASKNPLLTPTDYKISGKTACVNDLFRVVHDYFGHCKEGNGMRADGEENAWRSHSAMFTPLARRAMTSETRGQNSWVNFGPHAEANRTASGGETHYADQKVGLLPEWVTSEGAKAIEFIQFTKTVETKIARAAVKAAYQQQHDRVERQAAKRLAKYFQESVRQIVKGIPKFTPDPEKAKEQAASLIKRAFKASKQNDLLISHASQPVADAFLEGAYAERRLSVAAKRRKKSLKFNENHDESGRFASGSSSGNDEELAGKYLKVTKNDDGTEMTMVSRGLGIPETSSPGAIYRKTLNLLGLPGEPAIGMYAYGNNGPVKVMAEDEGYKATRYVMIDDKEIENNSLEVFKQHGGTGTKILADEVREASAAGFRKITTYAAKGQYTNGYYTWARLGFDCPINRSGEFTDKVKAYATEHSLKNVSDFMKSSEHRQWWKENGEAFHGSFDLTEGSPARERLAQYVAAKQATAGSGKSTGTDSGGRCDPGQDLGLAKQPGIKITTATQAARRAEQEIEFATTAPEWLTEAAQDFIIETFQEDYWLRIPETTRDDIELTLYEAIRDGKSIRDIASEIMDAHGDEYSRTRATMVARTEMTGAMNSGATASIQQAFEGSGLTPTKVWLSVLGLTTRETHADADGQEVLLDAEFTVGGEQCSYPGDMVLSAGERINCQCSLISGEVESQISSDDEEGKSFDDEKFNENHDHLGRFASAPDSGDGSGAQGTSPSEKPAADKPALPKNADEIVKRAEKIEFTEGETGGSIDSSDTSAIYDRMTGAERDDMRDALDSERDEWVSDQMQSWEPDDSIYDAIDESYVASEAGYSQRDIKNDVGEMVADNEKLTQVVEDWDGRWGVDGIEMLIEELDSSGEEISSELRDKLEAYKNEAEDAIQTERDHQYESLLEEARNSAREDYENQYDNNSSGNERAYLERFYEDNPGRFQSEEHIGKWVQDTRGDSQFLFKTSDDRIFDITASKQNVAGLDTTDVQFADNTGDFGITGKGKAFEVFGQVVPAVVALAKHDNPKIMTFSAHGRSRQRLYDRLVQQVLGVDDTRFAFKKDGGEFRKYVVGLKSERENIMSKITAAQQQGIEEITPRRSASVDDSYIGAGWQEMFPNSDPAWFTPEGWEDIEEEPVKTFDPSQPRDDSGKWTSDGGSSTVGSDHAASGSGEKPKVSDSDLSSDKLFQSHELALPEKSKQVKATKEDLYQQARDEKPSFDVGLNTGQGVDKAIGANVARPSNAEEFKKAIESDGPTVIIAGLKGEKRAEEKVNGKYGGDWSRLTDVIRATVAVGGKDEIPNAINAVRKEMADHGWKLAEKPDNRITNPTPGGYRDLNLLFRSENGHLAEIQINTKAMIRAKEGDGHKLYEDYRRIDESIKSSNREPTTEEKDKLRTLSARMSSLYNDAWAK